MYWRNSWHLMRVVSRSIQNGNRTGLNQWWSKFSNTKPIPMGSKPRINMVECNYAYTIEAELAGVPKDKIDLQIIGDNIAILRGGVEAAENNFKGNWSNNPFDINRTTVWAQERSVGQFERTIIFPGKVDMEHVRATIQNGLLTIKFPKPESEVLKARRVIIEDMHL
ncbi:HSP20-like chaperone [Basidiobolus meristosporus CBS 931.73]|uniref:HSP20-like chaperone n=1 Tax=Basidiobolus meristosporus CBS 931.73 TaxID=1314790 RepID=A0A1Y1Y6Y2_9FUNG|nr:HSP20-like chaperone [Basidiobolus meristosporus CBS 931.73]|eukprot:ORX93729.1 HSP20-like chaperone [Basidiobolus meristosporus CBS 931.73]